MRAQAQALVQPAPTWPSAACPRLLPQDDTCSALAKLVTDSLYAGDTTTASRILAAVFVQGAWAGGASCMQHGAQQQQQHHCLQPPVPAAAAPSSP